MKKTLLTLAIAGTFGLCGVAIAADMVSPPNSLVVTDSGDFGVGTAAPTSQLHVTGDAETAKILVEETSTTIANRVLYNLVNNGEIRFTMQNVDTSNPSKRDFLMATDGFNISLVGTGSSELLVRNNGDLHVRLVCDGE